MVSNYFWFIQSVLSSEGSLIHKNGLCFFGSKDDAIMYTTRYCFNEEENTLNFMLCGPWMVVLLSIHPTCEPSSELFNKRPLVKVNLGQIPHNPQTNSLQALIVYWNTTPARRLSFKQSFSPSNFYSPVNLLHKYNAKNIKKVQLLVLTPLTMLDVNIQDMNSIN